MARIGEGAMPYPQVGEGAMPYPQVGEGAMPYPQVGEGVMSYSQIGGGVNSSDVGAIPVPYISKLGSRLESGQTLIIHGTVRSDAEAFEVNLLRGSPEIETSIATILHVKALFKENKLNYNTYENGKWGKCEKSSNPFKRGEKFDLRIRVHEEKCEIFANNKEVHSYKPPLSFAMVEYLAVRGGVQLSGVHFGGRYYSLPYHGHFPYNHLKSGERVYIYGMPKGHRFQIDFLSGNGDSLFHFNPRFSEKAIVRNSRIGDIWGKEEREGTFTLKKDTAVDLAFFNEPYSIQVFVDGQRFCTFAHRTSDPSHDYRGLSITGDFELTGLEFSD